MDRASKLKILEKIEQMLQAQKLLKNSPKYWWPNAGSFEVVVGAILTQNTTWSNVERSLKNLEGLLELEEFAKLEETELKERIKPSGFYNQKAPRLLALAKNIQSEFSSFEFFCKRVSREWLLKQKGLGKESADAILCYGCFWDVLVVDGYTKRLLGLYGLEFNGYDEMQSFLQENLTCRKKGFECFADFHAMVVEYMKKRKNKV